MTDTGTIFDLVEDSSSQGYMEFAGKIETGKPTTFFDTLKEYGKSVLKGGIKGKSRLGRIMGPLESEFKTPEQLQLQQIQALEEYLPTEDRTFGQKVIERGLEEAPTMLAFPGSGIGTAVRIGLGATAGQIAEELGAPESIQALAEIAAFVGPDVTKKLLEQGKNKQLIQVGRKLGLSDEALTPLIQPEFKEKILTKLAPRRGATQRALERSKEELGKAFEAIKKPERILGEGPTEELMLNIDKAFEKMPHGVRSKISTDYQDLISKPINTENLMNFWADINYNLGPKTKQLSLLKGPIKEAIKNISPELAKDFDIANKLYSQYGKMASRLKPNLVDDLVRAAESLGIASSVVFGYYPALLKFAGEKTARKIAGKLLTDPKWQQLSQKTMNAIIQQKFPLAKKLLDIYANKMEKISPESSNELKKITEEELKDFFT